MLLEPKTELCLSAISTQEIALKHALGKADLMERQVLEAVDLLNITLLPFTGQHALRLYRLPLHYRDPFDRAIIATALSEGIPLVGGDRQFVHYEGLQVLW